MIGTIALLMSRGDLASSLLDKAVPAYQAVKCISTLSSPILAMLIAVDQ
jgi:hypothetical protein